MKERKEIIKLKILMILMGGAILLLVGCWLEEILQEETRTEYFWATKRSEPEMTVAPVQEPSPTPFVLSNFDKIRVVITNKETGGVYHKEIQAFQTCTDYRGTLEFIEEDAGYVVINELPIEEYLYSVVPSEMPASYPIEALKAQAICARTYAYLHILTPGYPEWNAHVDDTTAYQVYHSVAEQEMTTRAVNETEKKVLLAPDGNSLAQTYYYSTSCGYGSDAHVWRTRYSDCYPYIMSKHINYKDAESRVLSEEAFAEYITSVNEYDYECSESWYRWQYQVDNIDISRIVKVMQKRYEANPKLILTLVNGDYISQRVETFEKISHIEVVKRGAGGVADELVLETDNGIYKVVTELNIRYVLSDGESRILRQDGTKVERSSLLPSSFFIMELICENNCVSGYVITGGGFGHGAGMSQNAAKAMANHGMNAEEILAFFYEGCIIKDR